MIQTIAHDAHDGRASLRGTTHGITTQRVTTHGLGAPSTPGGTLPLSEITSLLNEGDVCPETTVWTL